jgi:hypothetical protein
MSSVDDRPGEAHRSFRAPACGSSAWRAVGNLGLAATLLPGRSVLAGVLAADKTDASVSTANVLPRLTGLAAIIATLDFAAPRSAGGP